MAKKKRPRPDSLVIRMGGVRIEVTRTSRQRRRDAREPPQVVRISAPPSHAEDWSTANWYGQLHTFTVAQRGPVKLLWEAWEHGNGVSAAAIVAASESDDDDARPAKIFAKCSAWGTMIRQVPGTRDIYKLFPPDPEGEPT